VLALSLSSKLSSFDNHPNTGMSLYDAISEMGIIAKKKLLFLNRRQGHMADLKLTASVVC
jgi:hypothetical protein